MTSKVYVYTLEATSYYKYMKLLSHIVFVKASDMPYPTLSAENNP